jgi:hypothetical protein
LEQEHVILTTLYLVDAKNTGNTFLNFFRQIGLTKGLAVGDEIMLDALFQISNEATNETGFYEGWVVHLHQGHHVLKFHNVISD